MKTLFNIEAEHQAQHTHILLMEIGTNYCTYAFLNKEAATITSLKYFSVNELEMETELKSIIGELNNKNFTEVWVCSAYATALLTPLKYADSGEMLIQLLYGHPMHYALKDSINEWQMVNAYSVPMNVFEVIKYHFPSARFIHAYTPLLKVFNGIGAEEQITIHFTTLHFSVMIKKAAQVQLAQTYSYKTPLDVVYYLLKICSELHMDQSNVLLVLSGFIEEASALYNELHQYFLNIHFAQPPAVLLAQNEYPQHFFTSTFNLAACVS